MDLILVKGPCQLPTPEPTAQEGRIMKVLVYGALPQQPNLGVAALAHGARSVLQQAFPGVDVRFRSTGPDGDGPISLSHTSPLVKEMLFNRKGLRDWTKSFDVICDIRGGDSFTDIYTTKRLFKLSAFPLYARALGSRLVLLPQTIGPFRRRRSRLLARLYLSLSTAVMARDPKSADVAAELGRPVDLTATDVVFAIERPADIERGSQDVVVNVSGLLWAENSHIDAESYRAATRRLIDALLERGREVTVLAHVVGATETGHDNDRTALAALRDEYGDRLSYSVPADLTEVRRLLASANVVVGARMHACLNALSVGTPAVPLAYSRKFKPLLDDIGWTHTVPLDADPGTVADQTLGLVDRLSPEDVEPVLDAAEERVERIVEELRPLAVR